MSRVVISGYYGFHNLGDEAVLDATVEALRRSSPGVDIAVLSATPGETAQAHGVEGVSRRRLREIIRALSQCDLFLSGGGSLFQDATSWRSPWYYLGVLALARRLARRTVVYAQGIGPIRGRLVRSAAARLLDRVHLITVRDSTSQELLAEMGVRRPRIVLTADPSLLLRPEWSAAVREERARWTGDVFFGLALRTWGPHTEMLDAAARAARTAAERLGVRWVCLPMHLPEDLAVADAVASRLGPAATVVRTPLGPREMLALIGTLDLLVGMRLHALLFAAAQGVPIVPLTYDPKVAALIQDLGEPVPSDASRIAADDLVRSIEVVAGERPARRARLLTAVARLRDRAALAPRLAADLLQGLGSTSSVSGSIPSISMGP
jgi:polysaccharide pyruvyl transferase CsaB